MKVISFGCLILAGLAMNGCMGRGEPVMTGPNTYYMQDQYTFGWADDARNRILGQAGKVCAERGQYLLIHNVEGHMNGLYPAASISFSCTANQGTSVLEPAKPTQKIIIQGQ